MSLPDLPTLAGLARSLAVYYGQPWKTRRLRRFYRDLVRPGDLCFDVGAHVGNRTRALVAAGARVVALEPQPAFHGLLEMILPRRGVVLRREAVGARPGRLTLAVSRRHPTVSSLSPDWIERVRSSSGFGDVVWDRLVEVPVTTLDLLIAEHGVPAFVKIDVEGMEAEILAGLSQPLPLVAVEYLPAAMEVAYASIARLESLGRHAYSRVEGERHGFVHDVWRDAAAMRAELAALPAGAPSGDLYARPMTAETAR